MKKVILILLLVLNCSLFAQNVETVKKIPFGTEGTFNYWTEWDPNEGSRPGAGLITCSKNIFVLAQGNDFYEYDVNSNSIKKYLQINMKDFLVELRFMDILQKVLFMAM